MNSSAIWSDAGWRWRSGRASSSVAAALWSAHTTRRQRTQSKTDPKINEAFKKPDVKAYIKKFESDDREVYARRHEIVAALGLKPGMAVADIGAGTGLFTRLMAEKVGREGKGLRSRYRTGVPGTHRGRREETREKADRDGPGESGDDAISPRNRSTWCF